MRLFFHGSVAKLPFMKMLQAALLAGITLLSCSCATDTGDKKEEEKKPVPQGPKLVGRIASIQQDKKFVLIQSYGKWQVAADSILTTRGPNERTANLRATGEKLGEFAAADLQAGTVEPGDAVYSQHTPKPPSFSSLGTVVSENPAPSTENPAAPEGDLPSPPENEAESNVQKNN